jgi:hypothetical protein
MITTNIERKFDLNFPISKVKTDIERVVKIAAYSLDSKNDIFNTYRISKVSGLEIIYMNITLSHIDDAKTTIHIVVTEQIRNSGHKITVDKMIDAFLERLSKALVGETDEGLKSVSAANKGCFGVVILFIIVTALGLFACSKDSGNSSNCDPNCSSVQCSSQTQSGARCKNTTTNCCGRCYQHK